MPARADAFGNGDGHHGAFAPATSTSINSYASIVSQVPPAATTLEVDDASNFEGGQLALIWQSTGMEAPPTIGDQTILDGDAIGAGRYEFVRIQSINLATNPDRVTLVSPTTNTTPYPQNSTQIVSVFEYTTVTIPVGVTISPAMNWNGSKGGIVVLLAQDELIVHGAISANAAGHRGGTTGTNSGGCGDFSNGGRGEGIYAPHYNDFSRLNSVNGGGAATCADSGGAGGGLGGVGGIGGRNTDPMWPPFAGVSINFQPSSRLYFGGGGGGGGANASRGSAGAPGGGVIFVRAANMSGAGIVSANGGAALDAGPDGAGGGGAGGTILLEVPGNASGFVLQARGGSGGAAQLQHIQHGGGGGGSGGVIHVLAGINNLSADVAPGTARCESGATYGGIGRSNIALVRECTTNSQCSTRSTCNTAIGLCVQARCIPCTSDTECSDENDCTTDRCLSNRCFRYASGAGTACTGGTGRCNGSEENPLCIGCSDNSECPVGTPFCNQATFTCEAPGMTGRVVYYTNACDDSPFTDPTVFEHNFLVDGLTFVSRSDNLYPRANYEATRNALCMSPGAHTLAVRVQDTSGTDWGYVSVLESSLGTVLAGTTNAIQTSRGAVGCARYAPDVSYWTSRGMNAVWGSSACTPLQSVTFTLPFTVLNEGLSCTCSSGAVCNLDACFGIDCNDNNECTSDSCSGGVCSNSPRPFGTSCAEGVCAGDGTCMPLPDAGTPDVGTPDVGTPEVGIDGGMDAGLFDAAMMDASIADATNADSATPFRGGQVSGSGCSCSLALSSSIKSLSFFQLMGLFVPVILIVRTMQRRIHRRPEKARRKFQ